MPTLGRPQMAMSGRALEAAWLQGDGLLEGEEFGFAPGGFGAVGPGGGDPAAWASGALAFALAGGLALGVCAKAAARGGLGCGVSVRLTGCGGVLIWGGRAEPLFGVVSGDGTLCLELRRAARNALLCRLPGLLRGFYLAAARVELSCGAGRRRTLWGLALVGAGAGLPMLLAQPLYLLLRSHAACLIPAPSATFIIGRGWCRLEAALN